MFSAIWRNRAQLALRNATLLREAAAMGGSSDEPSRKRQRLNESSTNIGRDLHSSLTGSISPPPFRRARITPAPKAMPSPFQLTSIRDLPASSNVDAVSLKDILCDPLITECWEFNYLHNLDFLMGAFDDDVRDLVKVHVVHGFWKNEDASRLSLKVSFTFHLVIIMNEMRGETESSNRSKPQSTRT